MRNIVPKPALLGVLLLAASVLPGIVQAASVGAGGYTNGFNAQPPAADWSTLSIGSGGGNITSAAGMDTAVQAVAASSIVAQPGADAGDPPVLLATAVWSSLGQYLQTRATGNDATLLMCTLVNNLGEDAIGATISYDFAKVAVAAEEVEGHRVYYSVTGAAGSWTPLPSLSSAAPGRLTTNLTFAWPNGGRLYLLWADDNGSPSPDTANQIDNFSVTATRGTPTPVDVTHQPQSQTVSELQPATFIVGFGGYPFPRLQWYTNGAAIDGATNANYTIPATPLSHDGLVFRAIGQNVISNIAYTAVSSEATLTVTADTVAPLLLGAVSSGLSKVVASFSERLAPASVTNLGNYSITGPAGTLMLSMAVLDASQTNLILTVSAMAPGSNYTLTVNGVTDLSVAANRIATNSQAQFTAATFTTANIGNPNPPGQVTVLPGGANITVAGSDISGVSDQFAFSYQTIAGDFDIKVRVQGLLLSDVWAKAGLMAREDVTAGSRYAASFATPALSGCFFQYRALTAAASPSAGSFPVTYPVTWLRLKRSGNVFTGYAGFDGSGWSQLAGVTLNSMPTSLLVGFAVTGRGAQTTAQFRDYDDNVASASLVSPVLPREPLGPSSRKTGFAITEIMYHPRAVPGFASRSLEFIEIYNSNPFPENIGNHRLSGSIDYTFAPNTSIPAGGFLVVARDPGFVQSHYGINGVLGPWAGTNAAGMSTNGLPGGSGIVRLRNPAAAVLLEVNYRDRAPYPVAADGAGHSLVLARASYGEGDARAWAISDAIDGSPGGDDPFGSDPLGSVVINEFLAHTDDTQVPDFIELYNHSNVPVDLSGAYLADEPGFIRNPAVTNHHYRIPNDTLIPARGFLAVNQALLDFSLNASGERIYLVNSNQSRVIDAIQFDAQGNGVSMGRSPDGAAAWYRMASRTPGVANSAPRPAPIVINELMCEPITGLSDDEYIELYNRSGAPVDVSRWRLLDGISYDLPANTIIASNGYLVVARNLTNLLAKYPNLNTGNTRGNYSGTLGNNGDRIALAMPETNVTLNVTVVTNGGMTVTNTSYATNILYVTVNEVTYAGGGRWGVWSHGGGSSLELRDPRSDNRQAANWADSDESAKGIWTTIEITNVISETLGSPVNDNLEIFLLGVGECLVDDVEVRNGAGGTNLISSNPGFETGTATAVGAGIGLGGWTAQGSHDQSSFENVGFTGSRSLHLRTGSRGDNGANRVRSPAFAASGTVVLRARAKWIRGWPELLLRLHGGGLEVGGRLPMQANLGTPGLPNSRLLTNIGPAVYEVGHGPILPVPNEIVTVTARVTDPDAPVVMRLKYRIDPSATYASVTMLDDGSNGDTIAGDGIYSARIPGQISGVTVPFYLEAVDGSGVTNTFPTDVFPTAPLTRVFPLDSSTRECLVRWGDTNMLGGFSTYHVWLTTNTTTRWRDRRPVLNNTPLDGTFVYNNYRVIYNMHPQFAGSPFHQGSQTTGPVGPNRADFDIEYPEDDRFLGATDAVWNNPGNPGGDSTTDTSAQSEQTTYLIFRELGIHYNYRRYIHLFIDGNQRSTTANRPGNFIFEDSQQANGDVIAEWSSDDTDGQLFKIEDWFEHNDNVDGFSNNDADLTRRNITGTTTITVAPYRFMFRNRARGAGESANDYTNLINLISIVSPPGTVSTETLTNRVVQFGDIADYEQWMRSFACQHAVGNWDSYGFNRGKNGYTYKPRNGGFQMWTWDIDFTMGIGGDSAGTDNYFSSNDPRVIGMWGTPIIVRAYWRAFEDIVNGPMNSSFMNPILDAKAAALGACGVNYDPALVATIKAYVSERRANIVTKLGGFVGRFFTATVGGQTNLTLNVNFTTITGTAPVGVTDIYINGVSVPVTWTGVTNWAARVALSNGINNLTLQGYNSSGLPTNTARTLLITNTAVAVDPVRSVVFSEIFHNPAVPDTTFVEVRNTSATAAFDIGGWKLNGLDYTFPYGTVLVPREYRVVVKSISAFSSLFGFGTTPIGEFDGNVDPDGETLSLIKPATTSSPEVLIDRVRYEAQSPWPSTLPGNSIQLIDDTQDNGRVSNWTANPPGGLPPLPTPWVKVTRTGSILNATNLMVWLGTAASSCYVDDISLVDTNGNDIVINGGFETGDIAPWDPGTNYASSVIVSGVSHSGSRSLLLKGVVAGVLLPSLMTQNIEGRIVTNANYTLTAWILLSTNPVSLTIRTLPGSNLSTSGNTVPAPLRSPSPSASPGQSNYFTGTLPPYDPLWLNELQSENAGTLRDNYNEADPWIEIYNAGPAPIDLSGYYLADSYASNDLTGWQFPAGAHIAPGEFKILWADGQPGQTSGTNLHTSFRLPVGNGTVALSRLVNGQPQLTDYLTYTNLRSGLSYGDFPDGQPYSRRVFQSPTGGGTNSSRDINVFINEWMAANASFLIDPSDGQYDDWFELYNAGDAAVDLGNYYLTDNFGQPTKYHIPNNGHYVIPAGGHLLVWADNDSGDNSTNVADLHVNFALTADPGEAIGLYGPDGVTAIDTVTFGRQTNNISEGRYADGATARYFMTTPTPRAANMIPNGNTPPVLNPIANRTIRLGQTVSFTATATDAEAGQTLTFALTGRVPSGAMMNAAGQFSWTPHPVKTPSTNTFTVVVTDNGPGALSDSEGFSVTVLPPPVAMITGNGGTSVTVSFDTIPGRSYQLYYKAGIGDAAWLPLSAPVLATGASLTIEDDIEANSQRFYKIFQVD